MTDELLAYWTLHEIDEQAVPLEAERAKLPESRRAAEAKLAAERRKLEAHDQQVEQWVRRRRELERDIAALEAQEKHYRVQLDAVTNQQQFTAVQHEIAGVAGKRSTLETEALTLMEDEERAAAARPALEAAVAKAARETADALARLEREDARLAAELAALEGRRAGAAARLEPGARGRYEKLRGGRGGRAVAAVLRGACGGCGRMLPPHAQQEAKRRDKLLVCDGCGRLLVMPPPDHPEA